MFGIESTPLTWAILALELLLRIVLAVRVLMRRLSTGVTLSWLLLILSTPFIGAGLYLLVGESRLGRRRAAREAEIEQAYQQYLRIHALRCESQQLRLPRSVDRLAAHAEALGGYPALGGNAIELIDDSLGLLERLAGEIDAAERSVHLLFYIWSPGGAADDVAESLMRAARRGIRCRVAVDAVGSARFLASEQALRLQEAGVALTPILPVGLLRLIFVRADHRNHRKIVVIDGRIGYTGSMNLADPRYFKQESGRFDPWVDSMLRLEGPAVEQLNLLFLHDWELETGFGLGLDDLPALFEAAGLVCPLDRGDAIAQLLPSGPGLGSGLVHELLVALIYSARDELLVTTPYFVPDSALQAALVAAAHRGVRVRILLPERIDSRMVALAGRASFDELMEAGAEIHRFSGGLLHTKAVTVDGRVALFGTANLDARSFWLNFELMMQILDPTTTRQIRKLQLDYLRRAPRIDPEAWRRRPFPVRLIEQVVQLFAPLL